MKTIKFSDTCSISSVMNLFAQEYVPSANPNLDVAVMIAANCAKAISVNNLKGLVEASIQDLYDMHVITYGELPEKPRTFELSTWSTPLEEQITAYFEDYANVLGATWLGTVDTKIPRNADGVSGLAESFANEVYRNLTCYHDKVDDRVKEKSAAQVLSAVGITRADIEAFIGANEAPSEQKDEPAMMNYSLKDVVQDLHDYIEMSGMKQQDAANAIDNASDVDDILAVRDVALLGAGNDLIPTLRDIRKRYGLEHLVTMITHNAPPPYQAAPPAPETIEYKGPSATQEDLSEFMGDVAAGGVDLSEFMGSVTPATDTAPPPTKRGRKAKPEDFKTPAPTDSGLVPPAVLMAMKTYTGLTSEQLGAGIGLARATFDNYAKGKGRLHASHENKAFLVNVVENHLQALQGALEQLKAI